MAIGKTDDSELRTLGERLCYKRKQRGWTQQELAERAGTNQAVIQKIENGKSLRPRKLDDIAQALDVSPAWLQYGSEKIGGLHKDAVELALAWSRLPEPYRSVLRDAILKIVPHTESSINQSTVRA